MSNSVWLDSEQKSFVFRDITGINYSIENKRSDSETREATSKIASTYFSYKNEESLEKEIKEYNISDRKIEEIDSCLKKISEHQCLLDISEIQNERKARASSLPLIFSNLLIKKDGKIDVELIKFLKDKCFDYSKPIHCYEHNLLRVLSVLETNSEFRKKIESITCPKNEKSLGCDIIRVTLGISLKQALTDIDAKKTVVSALFSYLRQGRLVNSCFATYVAITMLSGNLNGCLEDFEHLLHEGKLSRKIGGQQVDFPFLLTTHFESVEKIISLDCSGNLIKNEKPVCKIWNLPSIEKACKVIGIEHLEKIVQGLASNQENFFSLKIRSLIEQMVEEHGKIASISGGEIKYLKELALLSFESESQHMLQRVWENAIAGMAEAREDGVLRRAIIASVIVPLRERLEKKYPGQKEIWKVYLDLICKGFCARIQMRYDPSIPGKKLACGQALSAGAFVLYDRLSQERDGIYGRIEDEDAFIKFILDVMEKAYAEWVREYKDHKQIESLLHQQELLELIKDKTIHNSILDVYEKCSLFAPEAVMSPACMIRTPWVNSSGSDALSVLRVYLEDDNVTKEISLKPRDSKELLHLLIEVGKNISEQGKKEYQDNPRRFEPLIAHGIHAFSLIFGHPSFSKAWQNVGTTSDWIFQNMLKPGETIANSVAPDELKKKLKERVISKVIPKDKQHEFLSHIEKCRKDISVKDFRSAILDGAKDAISLRELQGLKQDIDFSLCSEELPKAEREKIAFLAVHFADTNCDEGSLDVHFCCLVNPGSGQLEMWQALEDGKIFSVLEQSEWFENKPWTLIVDKSFLNP